VTRFLIDVWVRHRNIRNLFNHVFLSVAVSMLVEHVQECMERVHVPVSLLVAIVVGL